MNFIRNSAGPIYLGIALGAFCNTWCYQWQFYAVVIPFWALMAFKTRP